MKKILVAVLIAILTSCATRTKIEYRDRDVNHYITNTVHDTLVQHSTDSVYFEVITKGDTVFKTKYKERTMYQCSIKCDGVLLRDFIPVRVGQVGYMYDRVSGNSSAMQEQARLSLART